MSEKTKRILRFQNLVALLIVLFLIAGLFLPVMTVKIDGKSKFKQENATEVKAQYQSYLENIAFLAVFSDNVDPSLAELEECYEFLEKAFQEDENENITGYEIDFSFVELLFHIPDAHETLQHLALFTQYDSDDEQEAEEAEKALLKEDFSNVDVSALKIAYALTAEGIKVTSGTNDISKYVFPVLCIALFIAVLFSPALLVFHFIKSRTSPQQKLIPSYLRIQKYLLYSIISLFMAFLGQGIVYTTILGGSFSSLSLVSTYFIFTGTVILGGLFLCTTSNYLKNNSPAQRKYLTFHYVAGFLLGGLLLLLIFYPGLYALYAAAKYFSDSAIVEKITKIVGYVFPVYLLFSICGAGIVMPPYKEQTSRTTLRVIISILIYCLLLGILGIVFVNAELTGALAAIKPSEKVTAFLKKELILYFVGLCILGTIAIVAALLTNKWRKKIDVTPEEIYRLLRGLPDDFSIPFAPLSPPVENSFAPFS